MSKMYDKLCERLTPKDEMIEQFVAFYGEEYREKITEKINTMKIQYYGFDIPKFRIRELMMKKYENHPKAEVEDKISNLFTNLDNFANNSALIVPQILLAEKDVFKKLGIDVAKIVSKDFAINNNKETKKLINFIKADKVKSKTQDIKFGLDSIRNLYSQLVVSVEQEDFDVYNKMLQEGVFSVGDNINYKDYNESVEHVEFKDHPMIKSNLSTTEKQFLQDFLTMKGPMSFWKEEFSTYVVKNINSIFNKDFKSVQEILNDESMKPFLNMHEKCSDFKDKILKQNNNNNYKNVQRFSEKSDTIDRDFIMSNVGTMAQYRSKGHLMEIPIDGNLSYSTIMHEVNHALSSWNHEDQTWGEINNSQTLGFCEAQRFCDVFGLDVSDFVGFNEIVNEYLTQKVMDKIPEEVLKNKPMKTNGDCGYTPGVKMFEKFLDKYQKVIIKGQLERGTQTSTYGEDGKYNHQYKNDLYYMLGHQNYRDLILYAHMLENINYGNFIIQIKGQDEKEEIIANEWFSVYKKDQQKAMSMIPSNSPALKYIEKMIEIDKFVTELSKDEIYEKLSNGEKINVSALLKQKEEEQSISDV